MGSQTASYEDLGIDMLCQDQAGFAGHNGDSGAPVFGVPYANQPARALGLVWGIEPAGFFDPDTPGMALVSTYSPIGYVTGEIASAISNQSMVEVACSGLTNQPPGCPP